MKPLARLGLYGGVLALVFAVATFAGNAFVPDSAVTEWEAAAGADTEHADAHVPSEAEHSDGLAIESNGYRLDAVSAPATVGVDGTLQFRVLDARGIVLTEYVEEHQQDLHAIVVRDDGTRFRHVHPELGESGTWSLPWQWTAPGSYRIFADFIAGDGDAAAPVTLSQTLSVAGDSTPEGPTLDITSTTAGAFDVSVDGTLVAGEESTVTLSVQRDGEPVIMLQPYLGAFGHLVALRQGDLAYQHMHPNDPASGGSAGPDVPFTESVPTPGRYLLYFDFQVDGEVHTASLALTAESPTTDSH